MITPTPGRIVWFFASKAEPQEFCSAGADIPHAAIVARVWGDHMVNLSVVDANGVHHGRTSVPLVQEGEPLPAQGSYATWMPYQVGQSKKPSERPADVELVQVS